MENQCGQGKGGGALTSGYLTRFELDESEEPGDGFLYVGGRGRVGESRPRTLFAQHYGFASRPPAGSVGVKLAMGNQQSMPIILGVEHPGHRPQLGPGQSALYDQYGNIIRLKQDGVDMDFQNRSIALTGGDWTINGPVTINGNLHVDGDITNTGTNPSNHGH